MKLTDLKPEWMEKEEHDPNPNVARYIVFQCPKCPRNADGDSECGGVVLPVGKDGANCWGWNGEENFAKVTLTPSIWHHCKNNPHFFVRNGEIQFA
jgi:hypothetical protein